jgi:hypothetical protein
MIFHSHYWKICYRWPEAYHSDLEKAMRLYIQERQSEFLPDGVIERSIERGEDGCRISRRYNHCVRYFSSLSFWFVIHAQDKYIASWGQLVQEKAAYVSLIYCLSYPNHLYHMYVYFLIPHFTINWLSCRIPRTYHITPGTPNENLNRNTTTSRRSRALFGVYIKKVCFFLHPPIFYI